MTSMRPRSSARKIYTFRSSLRLRSFCLYGCFVLARIGYESERRQTQAGRDSSGPRGRNLPVAVICSPYFYSFEGRIFRPVHPFARPPDTGVRMSAFTPFKFRNASLILPRRRSSSCAFPYTPPLCRCFHMVCYLLLAHLSSAIFPQKAGKYRGCG